MFAACLMFAMLSGSLHGKAACRVPDDVYHEVSGQVLAGRYDAAGAVLDRFMAEHPEEPVGPLLKAAVLQYAFTDYENDVRGDEFLRLLGHARELAAAKAASDPDDLWARYFTSAADGMEGAWTSVAGRLVGGVVKGRAGARGMSLILAEDAQFYDACLMRGSYRFWKSVALDGVSWLPFVHDERAEGIAETRRAIDHGRLTGVLGNTVLLEMLLADDPAEAARLGEVLTVRHPSCRLFAWQLGEAYKILGRYDDAVRVYTGIAGSFSGDGLDDGSGPLRCWWKLAVLAKTVGKPAECSYYCTQVRLIGENPDVYARNRERMERAAIWLEELADD
jgi:hypothetical protein